MPMLSPDSQQRRVQTWASVVPVLLVVCSFWLLCTGSALAADYTWSGGGSSSSWSEGANWLGNVAPSNGASIETLSFPVRPALTSSENNVTGLSVNALRIDDSHGYGIGGEQLTLGSGGLSVSPSEGHEAHAILSTPITLDGDETWNISGPPVRVGAGEVGQSVSFYGTLSGESSDLTINLNGELALVLGIDVPEAPVLDDELGTITINGEETGDDLVIPAAKLNASDGHSLVLHHVHYEGSTATGPIVANEAALTLSGNAIGPVTATSSSIYPEGSLSLPSLSLDAASMLGLEIKAAGSVAGTDYDQLTSPGSISLGGAQLALSKPYEVEGCALPSPVGQVYTLVSTSGSLSGTFGNAPNGSTLVSYCFAAELFGGVNRAYPYRINYNTTGSTKTVTATALPAVPMAYAEEPQPPGISGTAVEGQNLGLTHGGWANSPTSYADQWERCNSAGESCAAIAGATGPTYALTSADVGSTIRVQESASNSEGSSSLVMSSATAIVQAAPQAGGSSGSSSTSTSTSTTTSTASSGGASAVATISSAQVAAALSKQLVPSGKASKIAALLKDGGITMSFKALEAGTLVIGWYEVPAGAKLAKHSTARPVLVASGQMTFSGAGTAKVKVRLTSAGKRLLEHVKRVRLEARGVFTPRAGTSLRVTKGLLIGRQQPS
jgi:hypothetical protein